MPSADDDVQSGKYCAVPVPLSCATGCEAKSVAGAASPASATTSEPAATPSSRGTLAPPAAITVIAGAALVSVSWAVVSTRAGLATLLYTFTIVAMFAVSGAYHRIHWKSGTARGWMKRVDHSMIFVFIAGSYTPFALLALPQKSGMVLFWIVWADAPG